MRPDALTKMNALGGYDSRLPVASFSGRERNVLFRNLGNSTFANVADAIGAGCIEDSRGVAFFDADGDGDLDIAVRNFFRKPLQFLRNDIPRVKEPLVIRLRGTKSNRFAIGARVKVADLAQTVRCGSGYLSQSTYDLHFGVAKGPVTVTVTWPAGAEETFEVHGGMRATITEGGKAEEVELKPARAVETTKPAATIRVGDELPAFKGARRLVALYSGSCEVCRNDLTSWMTSGVKIEWLCIDATDAAAVKLFQGLNLGGTPQLVDAETRAKIGDVVTPTFLGMADGKVAAKFSSDRSLEDAMKWLGRK